MVEPWTLTRLDWPDARAAAGDWERLRAEAPTEALFLTTDWLGPWWRHLGPGGRPSLLAVRDGSALLALAPLYRASIGGTGLVALRFIGAGVSDYLDLMLPRQVDARRAALVTLFNGLARRPDAWDALDLSNLPAESPTVGEIGRLAAERGLACSTLPGHARPMIALDDTWDEYLNHRPGKLRYNLRSRLRRLEKQGCLRFRKLVRPDEVSEGLTELTRLHARRWRGQRTATIFSSSARGRQFYAEACRRYAARGLLDLTMLEVGGRAAAGSLSFVEGETFYYYLPAWEPEFAAYAPGSLLLAHLIQQAYAQGLRRFDFMLGDESYKVQWMTDERRTVRLVIGNRGVRGRAAHAALIGWHGLRQRARSSPIVQRVRRHGLMDTLSQQLTAFRGVHRTSVIRHR